MPNAPSAVPPSSNIQARIVFKPKQQQTTQQQNFKNSESRGRILFQEQSFKPAGKNFKPSTRLVSNISKCHLRMKISILYRKKLSYWV